MSEVYFPPPKSHFPNEIRDRSVRGIAIYTKRPNALPAWFLSYVFCRQPSATLPTGEFHPAIEKYEMHQTPSQKNLLEESIVYL